MNGVFKLVGFVPQLRCNALGAWSSAGYGIMDCLLHLSYLLVCNCMGFAAVGIVYILYHMWFLGAFAISCILQVS